MVRHSTAANLGSVADQGTSALYMRASVINADDPMLTIFQVALMLRSLLGVSRDTVLDPKVLAVALSLEPVGVKPPARMGLVGMTLFFDRTLEPPQQRYQIARAACDYALRRMGLLREVLSHDLAVEICGVAVVPLPFAGRL